MILVQSLRQDEKPALARGGGQRPFRLSDEDLFIGFFTKIGVVALVLHVNAHLAVRKTDKMSPFRPLRPLGLASASKNTFELHQDIFEYSLISTTARHIRCRHVSSPYLNARARILTPLLLGVESRSGGLLLVKLPPSPF
jgi:hypothetical protein